MNFTDRGQKWGNAAGVRFLPSARGRRRSGMGPVSGRDARRAICVRFECDRLAADVPLACDPSAAQLRPLCRQVAAHMRFLGDTVPRQCGYLAARLRPVRGSGATQVPLSCGKCAAGVWPACGWCATDVPLACDPRATCGRLLYRLRAARGRLVCGAIAATLSLVCGTVATHWRLLCRPATVAGPPVCGIGAARVRQSLPLMCGSCAASLRHCAALVWQFPYEVKGFGVPYVKAGGRGIFQPQTMLAKNAAFTRICGNFDARRVDMTEWVTRHEMREGILNFAASKFAINHALGCHSEPSADKLAIVTHAFTVGAVYAPESPS